MYCFFNKFFFKVEIFGNLPIFCHAHLVAIQDFVDREILFDRCGKCPMLCLFFDFKWTISAVKSTAHVMPCFMRQHSAFLCGGLAFAAINDKEIVKERDCEIVFEFNMPYITENHVEDSAAWSALGEQEQKNLVEQFIGGLVNWPSEETAMEEIFKPLWKQTYDEGTRIAKQAYNIRGVDRPELLSQAKLRGGQRVRHVTQTTKENISRIVANGIEAGIGREKMADLAIPLNMEAKNAGSPRKFNDLRFIPISPGYGFLVRDRKHPQKAPVRKKQEKHDAKKHPSGGEEDPRPNEDYEWMYMLVDSVTIPERSFIRASFDTGKATLENICKEAVDGIILKKWTAQEAADYIGKWAVEMTHDYFNTKLSPPKSATTQLTSTQYQPLFDTGRLYNSISYSVEGI